MYFRESEASVDLVGDVKQKIGTACRLGLERFSGIFPQRLQCFVDLGLRQIVTRTYLTKVGGPSLSIFCGRRDE